MDFREALGDLCASRVAFVVIGGLLRPVYAPANTRPTFDLDVVLDPARSEELLRALYGCGYRLVLRFEPKPWTEPVVETIPAVEDAVRHASGKAAISLFRESPYALVDVWLDIGVPFLDLKTRARRLRLAGVEVEVASPEDWRLLKERAGREKDRLDLQAYQLPPPPGSAK